jgi:hypothetical protein
MPVDRFSVVLEPGFLLLKIETSLLAVSLVLLTRCTSASFPSRPTVPGIADKMHIPAASFHNS